MMEETFTGVAMTRSAGRTLRYFARRAREVAADLTPGGRAREYEVREGGRAWEAYYRSRWQHDKVVRSTHGVNCTGSCSFDVFVKDGIIVWETQKTDYETPHPELPDFEPRGCPRGLSASWYVYSPLRVKYPYVRSALLSLWRKAREEQGDPVKAWESIQNNREARTAYQRARGKGGLVRWTWDEAYELIAASLVYTIRRYGPDRIFGFTPLPAMSMASFASGSRFLTMIGASMISFYDWYCDLPPSSPQIWGEQTDVPESADWYNSGYIIAWGSNLPQTRTPDAHFYTEARYRGTTVAAVAPDYADFAKFADHWLTVRAGTDGALALAMTHVVLREYFLERREPYFDEYVRRFTDLPYLVFLDEDKADPSAPLRPGRFVRLSDLPDGPNAAPDAAPNDGQDAGMHNAEWKCLVYDLDRKGPAAPNGSIGSRYGDDGLWNLDMRDVRDGTDLRPALSLEEAGAAGEPVEWVEAAFSRFDRGAAETRTGRVPVLRLSVCDAQGGTLERAVTTVFDLLTASHGLRRGPGAAPADYGDRDAYASPAWQEAVTGVPAEQAVRVARGFADNARDTRGRSMIVMGAGINHWYHNDLIYRSILSLVLLCGCQGVPGGGWAHYVGQEKVRPQAGWSTLAMGADWIKPPRLQNGTSFYYYALDSWRHELLNVKDFMPPHANDADIPAHAADCNALAARLGWMPFYPQFSENSLDTADKAAAAGASSDREIIDHAVARLRSGDLGMAVDDPDAEANVPRIMLFWRANPLGSNVKGHEYFLKYLLGCENAVLSEGGSQTPEGLAGGAAAETTGKLDLMITTDIRMNSTCLYSDIVLPAAHWYEYHDLSTTDMHPFIHPFTAATDPPWEAKNNWEQFDGLARVFSRLAKTHLGVRRDLVATPLAHDTPDELGQPFGQVRDWKKGETEPVPGKTMFNLTLVERRYPDVHAMYSSLGPNVTKSGGVGAKGVGWSCAEEYESLRQRLGMVEEEGVSKGMPRIDGGKAASEIILALSPESNGRVGMRSWQSVEKKTGRKLAQLSAPVQNECLTFDQVAAQPRKSFVSPVWSGLEGTDKTYSAFELNISHGIPFRTLTGRQHVYLDHQWLLALGESLPCFKPPLELIRLGELRSGKLPEAGTHLLLNYLTPHSKWSIHSSYSDTLIMRSLSRGGCEIWLNNDDAAGAGIADNDWLECCNVNGVFMGRAIVSHRIPQGKTFVYHAQERHVHVPLSPLSGQRGGSHNSLTRTIMNPAQMIGGYAQLSYSFNYYGPTGCQRDECVLVRKAGEVRFNEH